MRAFLVICLSLAAFGCKPRQAPDVDRANAEANPSTSKTEDESSSKPAREPQAAEPPPECISDRQCEGYLRCEDEQCVVPPAVDGRVYDGMPVATFHDGGDQIAEIKLEVADDPWEQSRGLMFRRKMHPDFGMLFVYPGEAVRSFWMKNTYLSLDMVHLDAEGRVVGVIDHVEPMTTTPRRTGEPARYVLELVAGRAEQLGIEKGVVMRLENVPEELAPR